MHILDYYWTCMKKACNIYEKIDKYVSPGYVMCTDEYDILETIYQFERRCILDC